MQTSYPYNMAVAFSGMKADNSASRAITRAAAESIAMGRGVLEHAAANVGLVARLPGQTQAVITDDAGTFTAGIMVVSMTFSRGSSSFTIPLPVTFSSDKATTMAAAATAIQNLAFVSTAVYAAGSNTITIVTHDLNISVAVDVSGITGTMTIASYTYTSADAVAKFLGVALHDQTHEQAADGTVQFAENDSMSIMSKGSVYVAVTEDVTPADSVYMQTLTDGAALVGMFGKTSTAGKTIAISNARWRSDGSTTVPAQLEINLP